MINFCTIVDGQNGSIETVNTWVVGWPPSGTNRPQLPLVGYLVLTSDARPYPKPVNLGVWASFNPFEPELVLWFFNNFFLGPKCAYILHFNSKTHLVFVLGVKCHRGTCLYLRFWKQNSRFQASLGTRLQGSNYHIYSHNNSDSD